MDFRQLEAFCAIIECGSFSDAARKLYITQPTISNHMRMLETELCTSLINRTTKTMTVTADGRSFYRYARHMLDMRDKAVSDFSRSSIHRLYIGASSVPAAFVLPEIMAAYRTENPGVYFEMTQSDSIGLINALQSGIIDAAVSGTPAQEEGLECCALFSDRLILATPDNAYYRSLRESVRVSGDSDSYDIAPLLMQPFIMRNDGSATRRETMDYIRGIGLSESQLDIISQMNDMTAVISGVVCGLGVSVLSHSITKTLPEGSVITYPLDISGTPACRTYYLIYKKNMPGGRMRDFIEFIINYANEHREL